MVDIREGMRVTKKAYVAKKDTNNISNINDNNFSISNINDSNNRLSIEVYFDT